MLESKKTLVPFVNYPLQYQLIKPEIDKAIFDCLNNGNLIHRKQTLEFEKNFAKFVDARRAISVGSCTDAMFLSLKALGIGQGDEVITVAHTYIATIDVIVACGAKPVLVDIGEDMEMDVNLVAKAITKKTKAIMPVYLDGRMADMNRMRGVAGEIPIVADAAQATGARMAYKGIQQKEAGYWATATCYSFYPAKVLGSYGDGGMIVTNDLKLADRLYLLRDHGEMPSYLRQKKDKDKIYCWGYNSILDNIQAAILNVKLRHLPGWIERRREIAKMYHIGLVDVEEIILPDYDGGRYDVFQNYVIRIKNRVGLSNYLRLAGIDTMSKWIIPNHKQAGLNLKIDLPKTELVSKTVLSLPMYPELTDGQVGYVIEKIRKFYGK